MEEIQKTIEALKSSQQKNGSFLIFQDEKRVEEESVLATAFALFTLSEIQGEAGLKETRERAAKFLLSVHNDWRFKDGLDGEKMLGTTFLALSSLKKYDSEIFSGYDIAEILIILTDCEADEGGPYYSLSGKDGKRELSLFDNVLIANFLALHGIDLPKLDSYIEKGIITLIDSLAWKSESPYLLYFISKIAKGKARLRLVEHLKHLHSTEPNGLGRLIIICSLINLAEPIENLGEALNDSSLPAETDLFADEKIGNSLGVIGNLLRLLALKKIEPPLAWESRGERGNKESLAYGEIITATREKFQRCGKELEFSLNKALDRVIGFDKDRQIGLLPYFFKEALGLKGEGIDEGLIVALGAANFLVWTAYTVYDDFLDGEGDPRLMPAANFCQREFAAAYRNLFPASQDFSSIFDQVMDRLDSANAWELARARTLVSGDSFYVPEELPGYGDFTMLSERSLAHGLGPMALLSSLGYGSGSEEMESLRGFFKNYLAARQLDDDAHDWVDDFKNGHVSSVVSVILGKAAASSDDPARIGSIVSLERGLPILKEEFWLKTLAEISQEVLEKISQAKDCLGRMNSIIDPEPLLRILLPVEKAALKAITEQKKALEFLESFKE